MTRVALGVPCGTGFGLLAVVTMLPLTFPGNRAALAAAFLDRFAIGLVITKAWPPILGIGAVGGLVIGLIAAHFGMGWPAV